MSDQWTERLSDYLDDGLDPEERRLVEAHLAVCEPCSATLEELRRVAARARALEEIPPADDLWPAIAARIAGESALEDDQAAPRPRLARPRRLSFTVPQLAAAGFAVMLISGGAVYLLRGKTAPAPMPPPAAVAAPPASDAAPAETRDELQYDAEIADLEHALADRDDELDTTTVRILRQNLKLIKQATAQARRALAADPSNAYLRDVLEDEMVRKLKLLQRAAVTANLNE